MTNGDFQTYLDNLGRTEFEVAESLRKEGITGKPGSPFTCPISNGVRKMFANQGIAVNSIVCCSVTAHEDSLGGRKWEGVLTPAINKFMCVFDGGGFPFLVRELA